MTISELTVPESLVLELLSDATFGRGEGTAGAVDIEIEHDALGCPVVPGKTLRGMLRDAWLSMAAHFSELGAASDRILGPPGDLEERSILRIGDAVLDEQAHSWIRWAAGRAEHPLSPIDVLEGFTTIRHQTAEERKTGAPAETTLRATRVLLRCTRLVAALSFDETPTPEGLRCLALAALGVRHGGLARSRGRGHLRLELDGDADRTRALARREAT